MSSMERLPGLAALFLVVFDQKVGYTVKWQRSIEGLDLDGVEYQSLPSGLHSVESDLIYFTKGEHHGISIFTRSEADAEHRNAAFTAVGALISTSDDYAAQPWRIAGSLRQASSLDSDQRLEALWQKHRDDTTHEASRQPLTDSDHPAQSLLFMLRHFGPLIFPLQRAAMLGRRILIVGHPPVRKACEIAYNLSSLTDHEHSSKCIYNVGVFDLTRLSTANAWIACTTDTILAEKKHIYDILIELNEDGWPVIRCGDAEMKATQQDLVHYLTLDQSLAPAEDIPSSVVEASTWSKLAYTSIMWWSMAEESPTWLADDNLLNELSHENSASLVLEYANRFSRHIIETVDDAIQNETDAILITVDLLQRAGLDMWSYGDREFVIELAGKRSGRQVIITDEGVQVCGLRIC